MKTWQARLKIIIVIVVFIVIMLSGWQLYHSYKNSRQTPGSSTACKQAATARAQQSGEQTDLSVNDVLCGKVQ